MDGNGRWAQHRGLSRSEGHRAGVAVVKLIVRECVEKKIPVLSVWAFGRDNWARPEQEVSFLMELFLSSLQSEMDELHQSGVRLMFTGDRLELSLSLQQAIEGAEAYTLKNNRLIVNVVFNYGGKWDIVEGAKKLVDDALKGTVGVQDITEALFSGYLSMNNLPDPYLFIRTSGEQRISNFFLWQLAYTELYFSELCWPDFTKEAFDAALNFFAERERRYGKTSQQLIEQSYV